MRLTFFRKPVLEVVQSAHVVSSEKLRGVVSFTLRISDKSTFTQEIILDATCPYLKFSTQVPQKHSQNPEKPGK